MRISGITNLYGYLNTSAMQRYSALRNASGAKRTYGSQSSSANKPYATQAAARIQKIYSGTKTAAQNMRAYGQNLMDSGKDGLFARAEEKGNTKDVVSEVNNFVSEYNKMVKNMKSTGGTMNNLYASQLQNNFAQHKEDLEAVGITAGKDGSLQVNSKVLGQADVSALKKAFGSTETFAGKAAVKSIYVEANAVSEQSASQYAQYNSYNKYGSYGSYGNYSSYGGYGGYGNYSGYGGYGGGYSYSNLIGKLFSSMF